MKRVLIGVSILCVGSIICNISLYIEMDSSQKYYQEQYKYYSEELSKRHENNLKLYQEISEKEETIRELEYEKRQTKQQSKQYSSEEGVMYKVLEPINIRSHMTDGSAIIGDVPVGEVVEVLNSFFSNHWKIRYQGIVGWVRTDNRDVIEQGMDILEGKPERRTLGRIK